MINGEPHTLPESDFTVVGASFAGSLLASKLARHGSVLLVDRRQPGTRLKCAGGIRAQEFESLEVDIPHAKTSTIILASRNWTTRVKYPYVVTDRRELDAAVLAKAVAAGAVFRKAEYLSHSPDRNSADFRCDGETQEHRYRKLILAKGYIFRPGVKFYDTSYVEIVETESRYGDALYFRFHDERMGYSWIFPLPGGRINIGTGSLRGSSVSPADFKRFKEQEKVDGPVICRGGGIIPLVPVKSVMNGNVFLFGDSAGMVYPPNGEGLRHITHMSGKWADCIAHGKNLNVRWLASRTFAMFDSGSIAMKILAFMERRLGIMLYPQLCRLATKLLAILRG
ncbi:MAG: hypothetical protein A3K19_04010 [Lentisphaerae bacterium RIFOXYB12_FULL_65_16]|nr:MAG: hypothetical protein A3K18_14180 [Lentisphaerae bacterium RIFOXYA12_64_32]OGV85244.1 MAG: hypothetical protein A3K19_04010 [Lentisphaerae bacterium RIFOXYB12_FULL_65_16]